MKKLTSVVLSILMVISMLSCLFVGSVSAEEANNSVTAAEIYDISGKKIDNEQTYTNVTTAVNGEEVTATVEYDKDSGAYFFLGWYDETGEKVSADEAYTFTPAEGKIYTPRIGSANLLGGSGSFENYGNGENLAVDISTLKTAITSVDKVTADNIPNYSGNNKWATNENAGYLGATWPEKIYDKDGNNYQQVATYKKIRLLNTFNVVEDATIAKSGRKYLHINGGGASSLGLENLNKNTDYKLSFYLRYSDVNANKIKSVGVTTTVNINNEDNNKNATLKSQEMLITLENAVPSHKITVAKCDSTELSKVSTTEWQKITVDFNSGNLEKLYLAIVSNGGKALDYYIDDMVLVKAGNANSVSAANVEFHDANGGAVVSSNEYAKADIIGNFDGTYTTAVDYDRDSDAYAFKGWYYKGNFITADETFVIDTAAYNDFSLFKAVIISSNLLPEAASFESYKSQKTLTYADNEKGDGGFPAPTSTKWGTSYEGTYFKDNYFKIHTVYGQYEVPCYNKDTNTYVKKSFNAHSGNSMLRINTHSRSAIRALYLTPNTDYQLTFYVMGTSSLDYLNVVAVADCYNGYNLTTATESTKGTIAIKKLTYTEGWQKVQLSFNSGEHTTLYLHLRQQNKTSIESQGGSFVDDLSLIAMPKVDVQFVDVKGNDITSSCANEAKPNITNSTTKPGYFVATANYESDAFEFKGWYDGDTLVSAEKSFEFANGKYQSLTAKVVSRNILVSTASYEGIDAGTQLKYTGTDYPSGAYFGGNNNAGYLGQTREETIYDNEGNEIAQQAGGSETTFSNGVSAVVTDEKAHTGKKSVLVQNNFWTTALGIDVKPNTDYVLSYYVLAPKYLNDKTVNTIERSAISTTVNTGGNSNAVAPANVSLNSATKLYLDDIILKDKHDGENWIKVTHSFNSMNLDKVYLVIIQTSIGGKPSSWAYIDDLTCYKTNLTAEDLGINTTTDMKYNGSSIRAYATEDKPQALRHKFEIKKSLINEGIALYGELVEYGSVAIRTDYLGGKELVKDGVYTYNGKNRNAVTGIAYQKDAEGNVTTNKIFQDTGESIVFTAALTGIGKTSSGTNYDAFGNKYSVRNYLIFRKGTKETIVYTETQSYSVFDVMKAIEDEYNKQSSSGSVDEKVEADYNTIQSIFSKIPAQEKEYNNWKNSQNS